MVFSVPEDRKIRLVQHLFFLSGLLRLALFIRKNGPMGLVKGFITAARAMPLAGKLVEGAIDLEVKKIEKKMLGNGDANANVCLPADGMKKADIMAILKNLHKADDFEGIHSGKKWAGIYHDITGESELEHMQTEVMTLFHNSNALYPGVFPSCRKLEAEIVQMAVSHLKGSSDACGLLSSGGTESILLAVLSYRQWARERGIEKPEAICSQSVHGAFDKACFYFGIKAVKLPCDAGTYQLMPEAVKAAINPNTIFVYCSAPSFPHGIVDPVEDVARVTKAAGIGLHVDNCLGGFYLSGLQQAGLFNRKFDFEVDGVTTISFDIHKYGMSPKGCSVVCFSHPEHRRRTIHPITDGLTLYVTPTLQGSRGCGVIAAAWATMMYMGNSGYKESAIQMNNIKLRAEAGIRKIPGLKLEVPTELCIVAMSGDGLNIFAVSTLMERKGWSCFTTKNPNLLSLCVGEQYHRVLDDWLVDLRECTEYLHANPSTVVEGDAAVYGASETLPDEVLSDVMKRYIEVKMTVKPLENA
jgi:sphinganine-1-phosphate aldolase